MTRKTNKPTRRANLLTIIRYELLWNIRKKKFIGVFILAFVFPTLSLALPVVFSHLNNQPIQANPDYVITSGTALGGLGFFLFALVTVMNSISGEFESGSIIPLLTKPVSRTTVYLGKISAAVITVLGAFVVLIIYQAIGGYLIYGPQNNIQLILITLLGSIVSTLVWMSIVLTAGSVSKSSMLAALLGIGVWFGLNIASGVISAFSNQAWIATYLPGNGASGSTRVLGQGQITINASSTTTGTDSIAANLVKYILNPQANVTFSRIEIGGPSGITQIPMYTEPLGMIVARSLTVAAIYILIFNLIAWYALRRAQITE